MMRLYEQLSHCKIRQEYKVFHIHANVEIGSMPIRGFAVSSVSEHQAKSADTRPSVTSLPQSFYLTRQADQSQNNPMA
jgi:hypothetical protein